MKVKEWATKDHTLDLSNERPDPEYGEFINPSAKNIDEVKSKGKGIDVEAFRAWCEALDKDKAWIEKTERELF